MRPDQAPKAWALLTEAVAAGWGAAWVPGEDASGAPYVTVKLARGLDEMRLTWHTRRPDGTVSTPRLFSAMRRNHRRDWHDITLKDAREAL